MANAFKSNATSIAWTIDDGQGGQKTGAPIYRQPFSNIGTSGDSVNTVQSENINQDRQHHRGTVSGQTSEFSFTADNSLDTLRLHAEQALFGARTRKVAVDLISTGQTASTNNITFAAGTLSSAVTDIIDDGTLIYIAEGRNKGFKKVTGTTSTTITVDGTLFGGIAQNDANPANVSAVGLITEASGGVRWAYTSASQTATVTFDNTEPFTLADQSFTAGQWVYIGVPDANGNPINALQNRSANDMYGYARIVSVGTNSMILDELDPKLRFTPAAATTTPVAVRAGEYVTNADVNETGFEFVPYLFEIQYNDGGARNAQGVGTGDIFNYPSTQYLNTLSLATPLNGKTTADFGFMGRETIQNVLVADRISAFSTGPILEPTRNDIQSTQTGAQRGILKIDGAEVVGAVFTNLTTNIDNGVSSQDVLFQLAHYEINYGMLTVSADMTMLFTSDIPAEAIKRNANASLNYVVDSDDGAAVIDLYSGTLSGGAKSFTAGSNIPQDFSLQAHNDNIFGKTMGISTILGPMIQN